MPLSREAILAAQDTRTKTVDVPEWGGEVIIRSLTAGWRNQFEADMLEAHRQGRQVPADLSARMVIASLVDEAGAELFTLDDVKAMSAKNANVMTRLHDAIVELNALPAAAVEVLKGN
jgi:hypothetical protein